MRVLDDVFAKSQAYLVRSPCDLEQFLGQVALELLLLLLNQAADVPLGQLVNDPVGPHSINEIVRQSRTRLENGFIEEFILAEHNLLSLHGQGLAW